MKYLPCILLLISSIIGYSQIPSGYYDSANGLYGNNLKVALHNIIKDHTEYPYTSSSNDVWDILKETDRDTANSENVILFYSGWSVNAAQEYNNGAGWNREHVWAKIHGDFGTGLGPGTDAHHLRPTDISVNAERDNKDFDNGGSLYIDGDGDTGCYTDSDSWETRDAVKGDVARILFYMAVRYEGEGDEPDLELVDQVNTVNLNEAGKGFHGKLSTLLEWNELDPVDSFEMNRNNVIYSYQGNRNPFIDHPEYAESIWETFDCSNDTVPPYISCVTGDTVQLNEDGTFLLTWEMLTDNVSDQCELDTILLDKYLLSCDNVGTNYITVTAYDSNGNSNACETKVEVIGNTPPNLNNDTAVTAVNMPVTINVLDNDKDAETSLIIESFTILVNPSHGIAEIDKQTGSVTYTPDKNYIGNDIFMYMICDDGIPCIPMCGETLVLVNVLPQNYPPIALIDSFEMYCGNFNENVLLNDFDTDGGNLSVNPTPVISPTKGMVTLYENGNFEYIPYFDFVGVDSFLYELKDDGIPILHDTTWVYITGVADNDCDGIADIDDIDDDNDGIRDKTEGVRAKDSDSDGIPDSYDIDSDNDGIPDNIEGQAEDNYIQPLNRDSDGDGWDDAYDPDAGGWPFDTDLTNTEGDTICDFIDLDSDNDGIADSIEGYDVNSDGIADLVKMNTDIDSDGLDDAYDTYSGWTNYGNETGFNAPLQDFDNDRTRDWRDSDDDNDGLNTINEDANIDGIYSNDDINGDGSPSYLDKEEYKHVAIPDLYEECYPPNPIMTIDEFYEYGGLYLPAFQADSIFLKYETIDNTGDKSYVSRIYEIKEISGELSSEFTQLIFLNDQVAPFLECPANINVNTHNDIPDGFSNVMEFIEAGGNVSDNCGIDLSSLNIVAEYMDTTLTPDVLTRTYSIADVQNNIGTCYHIITITYPTAVNDINTITDFKVFPNPNNGIFTVEINSLKEKSVLQVNDESGKTIKQMIIKPGTMQNVEINISNVASGNYSVVLFNRLSRKSKLIIIK